MKNYIENLIRVMAKHPSRRKEIWSSTKEQLLNMSRNASKDYLLQFPVALSFFSSMIARGDELPFDFSRTIISISKDIIKDLTIDHLKCFINDFMNCQKVDMVVSQEGVFSDSEIQIAHVLLYFLSETNPDCHHSLIQNLLCIIPKIPNQQESTSLAPQKQYFHQQCVESNVLDSQNHKQSLIKKQAVPLSYLQVAKPVHFLFRIISCGLSTLKNQDDADNGRISHVITLLFEHFEQWNCLPFILPKALSIFFQSLNEILQHIKLDTKLLTLVIQSTKKLIAQTSMPELKRILLNCVICTFRYQTFLHNKGNYWKLVKHMIPMIQDLCVDMYTVIRKDSMHCIGSLLNFGPEIEKSSECFELIRLLFIGLGDIEDMVILEAGHALSDRCAIFLLNERNWEDFKLWMQQQQYVYPSSIIREQLSEEKFQQQTSLKARHFGLLFQHFISGTAYPMDTTLQLVFDVCHTIWYPLHQALTDSDRQEHFSMLNTRRNLDWWSIREAAKYCVSGRLRTVLGNATSTFEVLEKSLNRISSLMDTISIEKDTENPQNYIFDKNNIFKRSSLFMHFMEELEKQIVMATEMYPSAEYQYPRNTLIFFASNKKVCDEWFTRLRFSLITSSNETGNISAIIRYSLSALEDYSKHSVLEMTKRMKEFQMIVVLLCRALTQTGDHHYMLGICAWIKSLINNKCDHQEISNERKGKLMVLTSISELYYSVAFGAYEEALSMFEVLLDCKSTSSSILYLDTKCVAIIISDLIRCIENTSNWDMLKTLETKIQGFTDKNPEYGHNIHIPDVDLSYIRMLSSFDNEDLVSGESEFSNVITKCKDLTQFNNSLFIHKLFQIRKKHQLKIDDQILETVGIQKSILDNLSAMQYFSHKQIAPQFSLLYSISALEGDEERKLDNLANRIQEGQNHLSANIRRVTHSKKLVSHREQIMEKKLALSRVKYLRVHKNFEQARSMLSSQQLLGLEQRYELLKLNLASQSNDDESIIESVCNEIMYANIQPDQEESDIVSKMALRVHKWMNEDVERRREFIELLFENQLKETRLHVDEILLDKALKFSVHKRKPFLSYANWCSLHADNLFATLNDLSSCEKSNTIFEELSSLISKNFNPALDEDETRLLCLTLLQLFQNVLTTKESIATANQLVSLIQEGISNKTHRDILVMHIDEVFDIFKKTEQMVLDYHSMALEYYFKALNTEGNQNDNEFKETNVTITLHIIKYLRRYSTQFEQKLVHGIDITPVQVWTDIIPQILAHLGNNEHPKVVEIIKKLLIKIGQSVPHLLAYPLVVGSLTSKGPQQQYQEIVKLMELYHPEIMKGVKIMISELGRMTSLWEELWLNHPDVLSNRALKKQLSAFKASRQRILKQHKPNEAISLIQSEYQKTIGAVLSRIWDLFNITSNPPETKHEHEFQDKYQSILRRILNTLQFPSSGQISEKEIGRAIEELSQIIENMKYIYRIGSLKLSSISPILANISGSHIPIPGVENYHAEQSEIPTIASLKEKVEILSSKTTPKKFSVIGSDGKQYTFLLKGKEDLHLDERAIQFLKIVNLSLLSSPITNLRARDFAVIPLGDRSGLLRWVDNAPPIFSLHRNWYSRMATVEQLKADGKKTPTNSAQFRPTEMFFSKLLPALKESGVTDVSHPYPKDILKKVVKQLMEETPKDILYKEIWYKSQTSTEWWNKIKMFNKSVGVMSMIGYVIGLGDRHLDNMLVDFTTSEIVHIDYNICFDKGLKLKVPEVVPFRMTPVISTALGIGGLEGLFKQACEETLRRMKKSKDTLLMLLEAFVYDPLVDWTNANTNDEVLYNSELKVGLGLFTSQYIEIKDQMMSLFSRMTDLTQQLYSEHTHVKEYVKNNVDVQARHTFEEFSRSKQQLIKTDIPITEANLIMNELSKRKITLQAILEEKLRSFSEMSVKHSKILDQIINLNTSTLDSCEISPSLVQNPLLSSAVKEFKQKIMNHAEINECSILENKIMQILEKRENILQLLIDHVKQYQQGLKWFSHTEYLKSNMNFIWSKNIKECLITKEADNVTQAINLLLSMNKKEETGNEACHLLIDSLFHLINEHNHFTQKFTKESGISFLEKGLSEIRDQVNNFIQQISVEYPRNFVLLSIFSTVHNNENDSFFGPTDSLNDELLEEEQEIEEDDDVAIVETPSKSFTIKATQQLLEWKELSRLCRIVSSLSCLFHIMDTQATVMNYDSAPTYQQLQLLGDSLKDCLKAIPELFSTFVEVVFPEIMQALTSTDKQVFSRFTSFCNLASIDSSQNSSHLRKMYHDFIDVSTKDQGKILLATLDKMIEKVEAPFKKFSLDDKNLDTLFFEKLKLLTQITREFTKYEKDDISDCIVQNALHNEVLMKLQCYVSLLIEQVTIPTLSELLRKWNINETCQKSLHAGESKFVDTLNIILGNFISSQQAMNDEKFRNYVIEVQERFMEKLIEDSRKNLVQIVWNRNTNLEIKEEWKNAIQIPLSSKNQLIEKIKNELSEFNDINSQLKQQYISYNNIEKNISEHLKWIEYSTKSIENQGSMLQQITERRSKLATALSSDNHLDALCNAIIEIEKHHSLQSTMQPQYDESISQLQEWHKIIVKETALTQYLNITEILKPRQHDIDLMNEQFEKIATPLLRTAVQIKKLEKEYLETLQAITNILKSPIGITKDKKKWNQQMLELEKYVIQYIKDVKNLLFSQIHTINGTADDYESSPVSITDEWDLYIDFYEIAEEVKQANQYIIKQMSEVNEQSQKRQRNIAINESQQKSAFQDDKEQNATVNAGGNSYAIGVLKRVQSRLESSVPVEEQVASVIHQATNIDRLCTMYEGWCPWI